MILVWLVVVDFVDPLGRELDGMAPSRLYDSPGSQPPLVSI